MAYEKTIWQTGDVITRAKLQKIEDQLETSSDGFVSYKESQSLTAAQMNQVYDNLDIEDIVRYREQLLTDAQKEQVQENLGIEDIVRYNTAQTLTDTQKDLVKSNLGIGTVGAQVWDENATYNIGDYVSYQDNIYRNLTGVNDEDPSTDDTNWTIIQNAIEVAAENTINSGVEIGSVSVNNDETKFYMDTETALDLALVRQKTIAPVYRGDYICAGKYLPSCCLRIGDYYYVVDAIESPDLPTPADPADAEERNLGLVHKFDIKNNIEVISTEGIDGATETWPKVAKVGHANSMAYDSVNHIIYLCPLFNYAVYTTSEVEGEQVIEYGRADSKVVYKFDENFNFIEDEQIGRDPYWTDKLITPCAISCDPVTNDLYCLYRPDDTSTSRYKTRIFKRGENGWSFYRYLPVIYSNTDKGTTFNQDFAVYNNYWFRNHSGGYIIWGTFDLQAGTGADCRVIGGYNYAGVDSLNKCYLGELEGMEFDTNGHLYAVCLLDFLSKCKNAFVTELPIGFQKVDAPSFGNISLGMTTGVTLNPTTQKEFAQSLDHIKSLNQIQARVARDCISEVKVDADVVDDQEIRVDNRFRLYLTGRYTCKLMNIAGGVLNISCNISGSSSSPTLIFTTSVGDMITLGKTGELLITGANMLYIGHPNNNNSKTLIKVGNDFNKITIRANPYNCEETESSNKNNFRVSGVDLASDSFFMGTMLVVSKGTPWNQYKENTYITSSGCNISSYIHSASAVSAVIDFTVDGTTIPQNTSVHFFEIHWGIKRAVSTQLIGSNGTIARLDMDTSGRMNITPLNQDCFNERFCTTLALPKS